MMKTVAGLLLVLISLVFPGVFTAEGSDLHQETCDGEWYVVQLGDSWSRIAERAGHTVTELKESNPVAAGHPQGWLFVGQQLCIPRRDGESSGIWITVRRGDSWSVLAARYGVSVWALQSANPNMVRPSHVLRPGDKIWIPASAINLTDVVCPESLEDLPAVSAKVLTKSGGVLEILRSFLVQCGAITADTGTVEAAPLRGNETPEVVVIGVDPTTGNGSPVGVLAVLGADETGWRAIFQSGVAAGLTLQQVGDINQDGHDNLSWSDTTCSAEACFTTVHLLSFVDGEFQEWIGDGTTMAEATVAFQDVGEDGTGQELILTGGIIDSLWAGPQRAVTNTWASLAGDPYILTGREYSDSYCLYHHIRDANDWLWGGWADNFEKAIASYRTAVDDPALVACWIWPREVEVLRAFGLYRLAAAHAYAGQMDLAAQVVTELHQRYPESNYSQLASIWWLAYEMTGDDTAACAAITAYARKHPDVWQPLANFGYANPALSAELICPVVPEE
ncbi:MAG: LysM peptidoglycan-binding domain-containing protein [Chloroflexota bacterium]|nr:LysM peptidoglycan-binding domain-containing protein [Chloroflexota bacterium]